jgi:predicted phosphodiesterase
MDSIAIISDVHSNLEALTAVMEDIDRRGCRRIVCLGDTVGYGADPEECVRIVRERCETVLMGNHDMEAACNKNTGMSPIAILGIDYTCRNISRTSIDWLASLPMMKIAEHGTQRVVFSHSAYPAGEDFPYIMHDIVLKCSMDAMLAHEIDVGFFGHTHLVAHAHIKKKAKGFVTRNGMFIAGARTRIKDHRIETFNVGSVGQPRDHMDWRAGYAMLDMMEDGCIGHVTMHRIGYDVHKARKKIIETGLPPYLGDRLLHGWPGDKSASEPGIPAGGWPTHGV